MDANSDSAEEMRELFTPIREAVDKSRRLFFAWGS